MKNMQEFVGACETIFSETEQEIQKVENHYNLNLKKGKILYENFKKSVSKLFDAAKELIMHRGNEAKQNEIRIQAVSTMKKIGKLTFQIRAYTNNSSFPSFTLVNKILIDQLYLDLINEDLQEQDINKTLSNLIEAYSKFENEFQPINNPPVPNTPA